MSRPAKAGATDEVRRPRRRLCARPVQHAEGWRLHRCGGIRRSSDARRARTPHAALASPAAARQSRVVLSLHARVWLRPETYGETTKCDALAPKAGSNLAFETGGSRSCG